MNNNRGIALILGFVIITILTILGSAIIARSISESRIAQRYVESTQAFWLAEAGVNRAINDLRTNYDLLSIASTALGPGGYSATITHNADESRTVISRGFIPFNGPLRSERIIEADLIKYDLTPSNFFDYAIYGATNIVINGNTYSVDGDVIYAGSISPNTGNITGTITHDSSISPLAHLNYDQLRVISQSQGNYHDAEHLNGPFPDSFWKDEVANLPNVVFLEGDLDLRGHSEVGGFFVVGGEVIYDATLNGNVKVNGAIYTRGRFTINGGGNVLNVDGGVWSSQQVTLNGNAKVAYNEVYMNAIKELGINTDVQVLSWRDTQNPYRLVP